MKKKRTEKKLRKTLSRLIYNSLSILNLITWGNLIILSLFGLSIYFFSEREYFLGGMVFAFAIMGILEVAKKQEYYLLFFVPFVLIFFCFIAYLDVSVAVTGFRPDFILDTLVPRNGKIDQDNPASFHEYSIYLEKKSSPVYISADPLDAGYISLYVYSPDERKIINIYDYRLYRSPVRRYVKDPLVYELCYYETGEYEIKVKIHNSYEGPVSLDVFYTEWPQLLQIDKSNCP